MAKSAYLEVNSGVSNLKLKYEEIVAARTLTAADSGKVFGINQSSGAYEITLPLAASAGAGWHCKFVLSGVASNAVTIANNTAEDTIVGMSVGADASAGSSAGSAVDEIVFISGAELGDQVELFCNGINYFAKAVAHDVAHITIS